MERKLYRSRSERIVGGVCGGIAEYYGVDPTLVRLVAIALTVLSAGTAVIAYIVMMIVVPEDASAGIDKGGVPVATTPPPTPPGGAPGYYGAQAPPAGPQPPPPPPSAPKPPRARGRGGITFGIVLVVLGGLLLVSQFVPGVEIWRLWPLIIVAIGIRTMFRKDDD